MEDAKAEMPGGGVQKRAGPSPRGRMSLAEEAEPMTSDARWTRALPSADPDGLDLSVEEARRMSREEFLSVFAVASLEDVPVVAPGVPGCLDRAPRGCRWYVRLRPAPRNPGPRARKRDSFELVVKRPKAEPKKEDVSEKRRPDDPPSGGSSYRHGLRAQDANGARLEALVCLARKAGRRRRASTWAIERIQNLFCGAVLDEWLEKGLPGITRPKTRYLYGTFVRAFREVFANKQIGDVDASIVAEYHKKARPDRSLTTRLHDLKLGRRALREGLDLLGVRSYRLHFKVPRVKRRAKTPWLPEEYDRLLLAAEGWVFNPDGSPLMVPGPDGLTQARRPPEEVAFRDVWLRAFEFLPYTGSRGGRLPLTRWVPEGCDPWIEVTESFIIYHRGGEGALQDKAETKRSGPCIIPVENEPRVRAWFEADLGRGIPFVFHKPGGDPYLGERLPSGSFKSIVRDAAVVEARVPHHFKDLAVEWSDSAGVDRETLAVHLDTRPETLAEWYGEPRRMAKMIEASERLSQRSWRDRGDRIAEIRRRLEEGRRRSVVAAADATPAQPASGAPPPARQLIPPRRRRSRLPFHPPSP